MTAASKMPPPVAEAQQLSFRITMAILTTLGIMGVLAFMQQPPLKQPKPTGGMSLPLLSTNGMLDSNDRIVEEEENHA